MDKNRFIAKLASAIQSEAADRAQGPPRACRRYGPEAFERYFTLDDAARRQIEDHSQNCPICQVRLARVKAQYDEIEQRYDISHLTAEAEKRWQAETRSRQQELWAAAGKHGAGPGQSYGLVVTRDGRFGKTVKCDAWVGDHVDRDDPLAIYGREKLSTTDGESYTPALVNLKRKLKHQFRTNPVLKKAELIRRYVRVDIGEDILEEAESLTLAILMAIVARLRPDLMQEPIAYSADLGLGGNLEAVRHVEQKVRAAQEAGIRMVVLAAAARGECPAELAQDEHIRLLFFNDLNELFSHFKIAQPLNGAEEVTPDTPRSTSPMPDDDEDQAKQTILDAAVDAGLQSNTALRLMRLFEDLCQIPAAEESFGTVVFMGDPVRIDAVLPASGIDLRETALSLAHLAPLLELTALADGVSYGLVADRQARIVAVRRVDVEVSQMAGTNPLFIGLNRRYGILSRLTGSLVWHFPAPGRHLIFYREGRPLGRYIGGRWRLSHPDDFLKLLRGEFRDRRIQPDVGLKVLRTALQMSEQGLAGSFVLAGPDDQLQRMLEMRLDSIFRLIPDLLDVKELADRDLMHFAHLEGATIIDAAGRLRACRAYFKDVPPDTTPSVFVSNRHRHGCRFSQAIGGLVVVASRDGTVGVYGNGQMLACY